MSTDLIKEYFDNLELFVTNMRSENLFNYNESNIANNSGSKKVIVQRALRQIERKVEYFKQSISLKYRVFQKSWAHFKSSFLLIYEW